MTANNPMPDKKFSWRFPTLLGLGLIALELVVAWTYWHSAPAGSAWLGDNILNGHDTAVYLSYLRQGQERHFLLKDLFAIEPHPSRLLAVWSTVGLIARTGIPLVPLHEALRWLFTLFLAFVIYLTARSLTANERDARHASILAVAGISTGWLYPLLSRNFSFTSNVIQRVPDLEYEFGLGPTILGGGCHIILSVALLMLSLRLVWDAIDTRNRKQAWLAALPLCILLSFHPYFGPLAGLFVAVSLGLQFRKTDLRQLVGLGLPFLVACLPAAIIFLPLSRDPVFWTVNVSANQLPLQPAAACLATLLPFLVALAWRIRHKVRLTPQERWLALWIVCAVVCMLYPFTWTKRFAQGLGFAFVFLTLPAWFALRDRLKTIHGGRWLTAICLLLAAGSPLLFIIIDLRAATDIKLQNIFYAPADTLRAWDKLRTSPRPCVVLSDNTWISMWTPAMTGCTTFVSHPIETPDYPGKLETWKLIFQGRSAEEVLPLLAGTHANRLLLTTKTAREKFSGLLTGTGWHSTFTSDGVEIYELSN